MGHNRLGALPRTRKWKQVLALLANDADLDDIASASAAAAERELERAADDPAFARVFWLLTQIPLAAREQDFPDRLRALGLDADQSPGLWDLVAALTDAVDAHVRFRGGRTDLGEMAQLAAVESLTDLVGRELPGLIGVMPEDVQAALAGMATQKRFDELARDFFARLARRHLEYYLSRELSNYVGAGGRFETIAAHTVFRDALDLHCRETARIIQGFSGTWFSKTNYKGGITPEKAKGFAHYTFHKLQAELRKRRDG